MKRQDSNPALQATTSPDLSQRHRMVNLDLKHITITGFNFFFGPKVCFSHPGELNCDTIVSPYCNLSPTSLKKVDKKIGSTLAIFWNLRTQSNYSNKGRL